jgi:hypothetical protein
MGLPIKGYLAMYQFSVLVHRLFFGHRWGEGINVLLEAPQLSETLQYYGIKPDIGVRVRRLVLRQGIKPYIATYNRMWAFAWAFVGGFNVHFYASVFKHKSINSSLIGYLTYCECHLPCLHLSCLEQCLREGQFLAISTST